MKKIKVFLRQWNGAVTRAKHLNTRPDWFSYEKCYQSLKSSNDIDLTIMLDGTLANHHFEFDKKDKVIEFEGGSDFTSFFNCLDAIEKSNPNDDDIIYLVEDDYLHKPGWSDILLEAFKSFSVDYVTLYDHKDKYFLPMYDELQSKILVTKNAHWRTIPSTCNTYAGKWSTFKKHWPIHQKYCKPENAIGAYDHSKFIELWKSGSNLISCIPGFSTHCEKEFLSPITNWNNI
jgi:glycosyltransferase involved in cell wall biosynthesis